MTVKELFDRWYREPLQLLEKLPNGDGAMVALTISCILYERYCIAVLGEKPGKANDPAKRVQFASDFAIPQDTAEAFWDVIRNGFAHQAMGLQKARGGDLPKWQMDGSFPRVELVKGNPEVLKIQPWLIKDRVLELWANRPDLIDTNQSFPWATIFSSTP